MNLIAIANETLKICEQGKYDTGSVSVIFPGGNYEEAEVITPAMGAELLQTELPVPENAKMCKIIVKNSDTYSAAANYENALAMNFANAHNPGGGFRLGATAQEEALCRCSTLYASITSQKASEMYKYNNTHISSVESDYMLISPDVLVFRDENLNLLEKPFKTAVVTAPAPNRFGAAVAASNAKIKETFERRIKIILKAAAKRGYRNLVLGAWGCGAFGNNPVHVAEYFKEAIVDENLGVFFDEICFAIYGREDGRNITAFRSVFGNVN